MQRAHTRRGASDMGGVHKTWLVARFMAILTTLYMHFGGVKSTAVRIYMTSCADDRPTDPVGRPAGRRALDRWELRRKQVLRERKKDWLPTQQILESSFWMAKARWLLFPRGHLSGVCFSFNIRRLAKRTQNWHTEKSFNHNSCARVKFSFTL